MMSVQRTLILVCVFVSVAVACIADSFQPVKIENGYPFIIDVLMFRASTSDEQFPHYLIGSSASEVDFWQAEELYPDHSSEFGAWSEGALFDDDQMFVFIVVNAVSHIVVQHHRVSYAQIIESGHVVELSPS